MYLNHDEHRGIIMKTTKIDFSKENSQQNDTSLPGDTVQPLKSIRPNKSMVRVKSLKPNRMNLAGKVAIKRKNHGKIVLLILTRSTL
jgi:hypothetical protein